MKKQTVLVTWDMPQIESTDIQNLGLWKDGKGNPCMVAETEAANYSFPLTTGYEVHNCNNFLRSLELGVNIHFENYSQYAELITRCGELLGMEKPLA